MRRIWKHLSLETQIDILLGAATGVAWSIWYIRKSWALAEKIAEKDAVDVEFMADYLDADVKATVHIFEQRALEQPTGLKSMWPGGPTFM